MEADQGRLVCVSLRVRVLQEVLHSSRSLSLLPFFGNKGEVLYETRCGLQIPSGVGQVFQNKQIPPANICLNALLLQLIFHLHVGWGNDAF